MIRFLSSAVPLLVLPLILASSCSQPRPHGGVLVQKGGPSEVGFGFGFGGIDETKREIERLRNQPPPAGNVRINITRLEFEETAGSAVGALVRYRARDLAAEAGGLRRAGLNVFLADPRLMVALSGGDRQLARAERSEQFLVLMPGSVASFEAVTVQPRVYTLVLPSWRYDTRVTTVTERVTGTGLTVAVDDVGPGAVTLTLMPYFHAPDRRGPVRMEQLATTLTVPPGMPVVLAGSDAAGAHAGGGFLTYSRGSRQRSVAIVLRVDVPQ